jgi:hypothetical protein
MKNPIAIAVIALLLVILAAQAQESIAKVTALSSGKLLLNGQPSNLAAIESAFKLLSNTHGGVWYYREMSQTEPPREAMAIIDLVVKYRLPVSLSSKPDFSDYIDEKGDSRPRKRLQP